MIDDIVVVIIIIIWGGTDPVLVHQSLRTQHWQVHSLMKFHEDLYLALVASPVHCLKCRDNRKTVKLERHQQLDMHI